VIGAHRTKVEAPLLVGTDYQVEWRESRVNLAELAKLRYIDGWSRQQLADHYQKSLFAITNYCQNMRRKDFNLEGLTKEERKRIKWTYKN
jgi:hypothetical protein